MTVGIVGLGLIGGSLARSIKVHTDFEVLGMDINPQTMLQANLLGAIDGTLTEDNLARCDVVLVALRENPGTIAAATPWRGASFPASATPRMICSTAPV